MALISLDVRRQTGPIDPNIYGVLIEHLGDCIYGLVYDPDSPRSNELGFRLDVIEAVRQLRVSNLRWPGGNFASGYHWMDGVGPAEQRPRRMELAWNAVESNQFGTDEFLCYCRLVGAEPQICVNMGSGGMDEARNWLEYCNGSRHTYYADLRRAHGRDEPCGVKYWGLGNEISNEKQIGHRDAAHYADDARELAKVMKWTDPTVELIACGSILRTPEEMQWNRIVVERLIDLADYLSIHMYITRNAATESYHDYMAAGSEIEAFIKAVRGTIAGAAYHSKEGRSFGICFDEWNTLYSHGRGGYTLADALVAAMFLNAFIRNADILRMANLAQLPSLVQVSPSDMFRQAVFPVFELFSAHNRGAALDAYTECETYQTSRREEVPYLDASASYDRARRTIAVNVINRHLSDAIPVRLESTHGGLRSAARHYLVYADEIEAANDFAHNGRVAVRTLEVEASDPEVRLELPPHSFSTILLPMR